MKEKIKEFIKKRWYFILGILLLILFFAISVVFYIKFDKCSNKEQAKCEPCVETKCEEVKCDSNIQGNSEEDKKESIKKPDRILTVIRKTSDYGNLLTYNTKGILKNGYLTGKWYMEELKNTKFVGLATVNSDIGGNQVNAITSNGELYHLYEDWCDSDADDVLCHAHYEKKDLKIKGKVTKVEYMLLDESYNGIPFYTTVLVLTINSKKYVITDDNGEIFFHLNENNNYHCSKTLESFYEELLIFGVGNYSTIGWGDETNLQYVEVLKDGTLQYDGSDKNLIFSYKSKPIKVEYTIFKVGNTDGSVLYVVSTDNKFYKISDIDNSKVKFLGDIKKIEVDGEKGSRLMKIVLKSGDVFNFVDGDNSAE